MTITEYDNILKMLDSSDIANVILALDLLAIWKIKKEEECNKLEVIHKKLHGMGNKRFFGNNTQLIPRKILSAARRNIQHSLYPLKNEKQKERIVDERMSEPFDDVM